MLIILQHYRIVFIVLKRATLLLLCQALMFVIGAAQLVTGAVLLIICSVG